MKNLYLLEVSIESIHLFDPKGYWDDLRRLVVDVDFCNLASLTVDKRTEFCNDRTCGSACKSIASKRHAEKIFDNNHQSLLFFGSVEKFQDRVAKSPLIFTLCNVNCMSAKEIVGIARIKLDPASFSTEHHDADAKGFPTFTVDDNVVLEDDDNCIIGRIHFYLKVVFVTGPTDEDTTLKTTASASQAKCCCKNCPNAEKSQPNDAGETAEETMTSKKTRDLKLNTIVERDEDTPPVAVNKSQLESAVAKNPPKKTSSKKAKKATKKSAKAAKTMKKAAKTKSEAAKKNPIAPKAKNPKKSKKSKIGKKKKQPKPASTSAEIDAENTANANECPCKESSKCRCQCQNDAPVISTSSSSSLGPSDFMFVEDCDVCSKCDGAKLSPRVLEAIGNGCQIYRMGNDGYFCTSGSFFE